MFEVLNSFAGLFLLLAAIGNIVCTVLIGRYSDLIRQIYHDLFTLFKDYWQTKHDMMK